ncbi:ATP-binding protein [Rhizobium sp. L1K21]|uniref:ATP-binding protein n=1 Tax=Rhizobium sp. L1K21 TaxID=2954933 RepID=UPI002092052B|nr:ATP-binding protein [Rhizobium sp. L1K21]MCO6185526.1 ATP-binding protein [Rhizobium sp. L1K21]
MNFASMAMNSFHVRPFSLLVVDDDEGDRMQIRRMIKKAGLDCQISEAMSIDEAVSACETDIFECALVDYHLPGHDGLSGLAKLRKRAPDMSVIISTGQGDELLAAEAMRRGAVNYIPKKAINEYTVVTLFQQTLERHDLDREMREHRQALESFAFILAQDVRTPLRNIGINVEKAIEGIQKGWTDEAVDHCHSIRKSVGMMNELVDALQDYNRQTLEDVVHELRPFATIIDDVAFLLREALTEANAEIRCAPLPDVRGHIPQLRLLMQNLIENALKFRSARRLQIAIGVEERAGRKCYFVRDNGIGIAEEHQEIIFNPFRRLATASETEGTGLGLATCRKIVERHRGEIWCESKPGEGSTFFFTLGNGH